MRKSPDDSPQPRRRGPAFPFFDVEDGPKPNAPKRATQSAAERIIATLREPFMVLEATLRVVSANAAFYRTFSATSAEVEGRFIHDLGNGQWDIPDLRALLAGVLPQPHAFQDFEVEHEFPSLGHRCMLVSGSPLVSDDDGPAMILVTIADVTDRQRIQRALAASEARYRRLFETAKDGILILDALSGRILDANPFMTQLLGYSHPELQGKELWEIGLFSDKSENEAAFRQLQTDGYVRYEHLALETKTGERAEVEFVSNVYFTDGHKVAQCNIRDISQRIQLQRQTQEQAAELSDLHRRKDEFLAMLSHELRNPLAPILNGVHLLRLEQASENPVQTRARAIIERQVAQLTRLVDDLLEVARITTGTVWLRLEEVAINGIVAMAVETAQPLFEQRKQRLLVTVPNEPIWLRADAARVAQVITNLLNNAAKYTDEGGNAWLTVEQDGDSCVIRVRDTGVGIAPEVIPHIFDLFAQADRSLDRARGGLGIGLTLVQRLTALHGGTVHVNSVLGSGSEFVVRLPALSGPLSTPNTPDDASVYQDQTFRVLIVEDNIDAAERVAMLVRAAGYQARTVYDGAKAIEVALAYEPHAVLIDIGLPGLTGDLVAKQMRAHPRLRDSLLVALTGYGQDGDKDASLAAGFDHHLVKPARFDRIRKILETLVPVPLP